MTLCVYNINIDNVVIIMYSYAYIMIIDAGVHPNFAPGIKPQTYL